MSEMWPLLRPLSRRLALLGGASSAAGLTAGLAQVTYDVTDDGSFEIPYALRTAPHRIVYTLPGESVPR